MQQCEGHVKDAMGGTRTSRSEGELKQLGRKSHKMSASVTNKGLEQWWGEQGAGKLELVGGKLGRDLIFAFIPGMAEGIALSSPLDGVCIYPSSEAGAWQFLLVGHLPHFQSCFVTTANGLHLFVRISAQSPIDLRSKAFKGQLPPAPPALFALKCTQGRKRHGSLRAGQNSPELWCLSGALEEGGKKVTAR